MINPLKHVMRTGSLVRLASNIFNHTFLTSEAWESGEYSFASGDHVVDVKILDIGLVVDDLIEEEEEHDLLVLFCEKLVRADCRTLRRVK